MDSAISNFLARCSVVDTESTSTDPVTCDIIELACSIFDLNENDWKTFVQRYKPTIDIPPLSAEAHFIRDIDVANEPSFASFDQVDTLTNIAPLVEYFIAHNSSYDQTAIKNNMMRFGVVDKNGIAAKERWLCTLRLAQKLFADDNTIEAYRLSYLWFRLGLCNSTNKQIISHKADSDIFMAGKLFEYLLKEMIQRGIVDPAGDIGQQVYEYQTAPMVITKWPFGKHKGVEMENIPLSYFEWAIQNMTCFNEDAPDFNSDLATAVVKQFELRG